MTESEQKMSGDCFHACNTVCDLPVNSTLAVSFVSTVGCLYAKKGSRSLLPSSSMIRKIPGTASTSKIVS